jgi:hypothetical protein
MLELQELATLSNTRSSLQMSGVVQVLWSRAGVGLRNTLELLRCFSSWDTRLVRQKQERCGTLVIYWTLTCRNLHKSTLYEGKEKRCPSYLWNWNTSHFVRNSWSSGWPAAYFSLRLFFSVSSPTVGAQMPPTTTSVCKVFFFITFQNMTITFSNVTLMTSII